MGKKSGSGSGKNYPVYISASLETIFWVKILKFFDVDLGSGIFLTLDPGSGLEKIRIRDKHPGSATLAVGTAGRKESFHVMCANQFSNES
jgi:hypothetical protein